MYLPDYPQPLLKGWGEKLQMTGAFNTDDLKIKVAFFFRIIL